MNIELYIKNRLCDINSPESLGIRLKRQFINPAELSIKDAQKSYEITLPATPVNNEIFSHVNVEEVKGKFLEIYDAYLRIDEVTVFSGKFRLSEIGYDYYSGNLGVPVKKTVKDVFGDMEMNGAGEWLEPFGAFPQAMNEKNEEDNPDFFFPYVLYGLLPKRKDNDGQYSPKKLWDNTVVPGIENFPPSINCLEAIRHIFKSKDYEIGGSAYNDEKLKRLYMSYKNPVDYTQPWNYGDLAQISVKGSWSIAEKNGSSYSNFERHIGQTTDSYGAYYNIDLFDCNRSEISYSDTGTNIFYNEYKDSYADREYIRKNFRITIPQSGFYKVGLKSSIRLNNTGEYLRLHDNGNKFTSTKQSHDSRNNTFDRSMYEVQVLRDFGDNNFNGNNIVGHYNEPNFLQMNYTDKNQFPKYYPYTCGAMVIDPQVNRNFINGLHWGRNDDNNNPKDTNYKCNYMFIQNGYSYNSGSSQDEKILSIYDSSYEDDGYNYWGYGTNDDEETETDLGDDDVPNPIWYKASKRKGKLINRPSYSNQITSSGNVNGEGIVHSIIWLEKGEHLTINAVGNLGDMRRGSNHHSEFDQWIVLIDKIEFELTIEAFRTDKEYDNFDSKGNYSPDKILSWTDIGNFQSGYIDLVKFLPSGQKVDDWMDNFCKAFNLQLSQASEKRFELDVKQNKKIYNNMPINLDNKANVNLGRKNASLSLPTYYDIGFTINQDEQGYIDTGRTGTEMFYTGSITGTTLKQTSNFSFNWLKDIELNIEGIQKTVKLPVITDKEIWQTETSRDYESMLSKVYTDLAQRFWYKENNFAYTDNKNRTFVIAQVKNEIENIIDLNYYNRFYSILRNYFTIFVDKNADYTIVECILTPDEYSKLPYSYVRFNGDIYIVAEIDGFDPLGRAKATLKLIGK